MLFASLRIVHSVISLEYAVRAIPHQVVNAVCLTSYCSFYHLIHGYDGNGAVEYDVRTIPHQVVSAIRLSSYCSFRYLTDCNDSNEALETPFVLPPIRW